MAERETDRSSEEVVVGRVRGARGLDGQIRVNPLNASADVFQPGMCITLRHKVSGVLECVIQEFRAYGNGEVAIRCPTLASREEAERWKGADVLVARSALPPAPDGEFYYFELEGLNVVTEDGTVLGCIDEILPVPQGEIFIIRRGGKELLIPSAGEIVRSIEPQRGVMVVRLLEGMDFE